jgi:hypothetical protein
VGGGLFVPAYGCSGMRRNVRPQSCRSQWLLLAFYLSRALLHVCCFVRIITANLALETDVCLLRLGRMS